MIQDLLDSLEPSELQILKGLGIEMTLEWNLWIKTLCSNLLLLLINCQSTLSALLVFILRVTPLQIIQLELTFQLDMEEMASHLINQVEEDQILQEEADQEEADQEEVEEDLQDLLQDGLEREGYPIGLSSLQEDLHQDFRVGHQDLQADHQDLQEDHQDHRDLPALAEIIIITGSMDHRALEVMLGLQDLQDQRMQSIVIILTWI
ncbi:hypothetical protein FRC06_009165 [Ceratobasidium sp. 370]|nr:hypothetical protein FRC06_009165 [Ceratobasidium sp. 370]